MKFLNLFYFVLILTFSTPSFTQDADDANVDQEPTTVEALLALVKEGKVKEQAENNKREKAFLASKNKQASIFAAEKKRACKTRKNCR